MSGSLAKVSILIVDDSAHIRRLVVTMLRNFGCEHITEAKNARQALDILNRRPPDIALIDWMLEDSHLNGMELVSEIRRSSNDELSYMPIIMVTGHTERDNIELARDKGVTEFLAKPFTARGLFSRISALIEQPRPFVKTRTYFGPDRRRRNLGPAEDGERRNTVAIKEKKK